MPAPAFPWLQALNVYIMLVNLGALAVMWLDKRLARGGLRRVPERTLWALAWLAGGPGAWLGMRLFHHKTRHTSFRLGFPLLALAQAALYLFLFR
ncbi:MAG: DUF1294 domain-containing protein [Bacillota bacterium]